MNNRHFMAQGHLNLGRLEPLYGTYKRVRGDFRKFIHKRNYEKPNTTMFILDYIFFKRTEKKI